MLGQRHALLFFLLFEEVSLGCYVSTQTLKKTLNLQNLLFLHIFLNFRLFGASLFSRKTLLGQIKLHVIKLASKAFSAFLSNGWFIGLFLRVDCDHSVSRLAVLASLFWDYWFNTSMIKSERNRRDSLRLVPCESTHLLFISHNLLPTCFLSVSCYFINFPLKLGRLSSRFLNVIPAGL